MNQSLILIFRVRFKGDLAKKGEKKGGKNEERPRLNISRNNDSASRRETIKRQRIPTVLFRFVGHYPIYQFAGVGTYVVWSRVYSTL